MLFSPIGENDVISENSFCQYNKNVFQLKNFVDAFPTHRSTIPLAVILRSETTKDLVIAMGSHAVRRKEETQTHIGALLPADSFSWVTDARLLVINTDSL